MSTAPDHWLQFWLIHTHEFNKFINSKSTISAIYIGFIRTFPYTQSKTQVFLCYSFYAANFRTPNRGKYLKCDCGHFFWNLLYIIRILLCDITKVIILYITTSNLKFIVTENACFIFTLRKILMTHFTFIK